MLAFLGPVSQLYHLEEGTKEEIVGCGYVGMSGFMATVERPCWRSTLYLPGVCEPLCCWGGAVYIVHGRVEEQNLGPHGEEETGRQCVWSRWLSWAEGCNECV